MRNRAFLNVVLLGLLTFALAPGLAGAASQGQDLTGMLASSAAERAAAVSGPVSCSVRPRQASSFAGITRARQPRRSSAETTPPSCFTSVAMSAAIAPS